MKEIIQKAVKQTNARMKKKRTKKMPMDLFAEFSKSPFDFKKDPILRLGKKKKSRSLDIQRWKVADFLSYVMEQVPNSFVRLQAYDKQQIKRLQDRITSNLEYHTKDATQKCDKKLLKQYLDWWISANVHIFKSVQISVDFFANEKSVREFFQTGSWMPVKTSQSLPEIIKQSKPPPRSYNSLYDAGGLKKLIYDAGVVDSHHFLCLRKNPEQAKKELRKLLFSLHPAFFEHVLKITLQKAPYSPDKKCDVFFIIKNSITKHKITGFDKSRFVNLFEKE